MNKGVLKKETGKHMQTYVTDSFDVDVNHKIIYQRLGSCKTKADAKRIHLANQGQSLFIHITIPI